MSLPSRPPLTVHCHQQYCSPLGPGLLVLMVGRCVSLGELTYTLQAQGARSWAGCAGCDCAAGKHVQQRSRCAVGLLSQQGAGMTDIQLVLQCQATPSCCTAPCWAVLLRHNLQRSCSTPHHSLHQQWSEPAALPTAAHLRGSMLTTTACAPYTLLICSMLLLPDSFPLARYSSAAITASLPMLTLSAPDLQDRGGVGGGWGQSRCERKPGMWLRAGGTRHSAVDCVTHTPTSYRPH